LHGRGYTSFELQEKSIALCWFAHGINRNSNQKVSVFTNFSAVCMFSSILRASGAAALPSCVYMNATWY